MNKKEYKEYLKSAHWKEKKAKAKKKCFICGSKYNLNLHHKTYKRLGKERNNDLISLCKECHKIVHIYLIIGEGKRITLYRVASLLRKKLHKYHQKTGYRYWWDKKKSWRYLQLFIIKKGGKAFYTENLPLWIPRKGK